MIHVTNYHPCMFNSNFLKHNHDHRTIIYYLFSIIEVHKNEGKELLAARLFIYWETWIHTLINCLFCCPLIMLLKFIR